MLPPVSSSATAIHLRRRVSILLNPRGTFTAPLHVDPWSPGARRTPAAALSTSATPSPPPAIAVDPPALLLRPIRALGEHQRPLLPIFALDVVDVGRSLDQNAARRRALPRRSAPATTRTCPEHPEARKCPWWITHVTLVLSGTNPSFVDPRSIYFDELRRSAAAETNLRRPPPQAALPFNPNCPIRDQRVRLDHVPLQSRPSNLDPTDPIPSFRSDRPIQIGPSVSPI
jgi:hypothetical protein